MTFTVRKTLLAALGLLVFCPAVLGQQAKSQPVARLIGRFAVNTPPATTIPAATSPTLAEAREVERRAFEQTNQVRMQNGLPPFEWDADVCRMARSHSENMSRLNFFSHVTPDGLRIRERARAVGILAYKVMGENIAYNQGYEDPGAFAVERWMASEKHRANILSTEFRAMAIGMYVAPDGSVFLTQTFITR
jgi:uncharacterized protein YkwD